ncbi:DNA-binding response OmpR family regulator [Pontibacter ummariensis]|uniref:DNA-binding response regulator, OmpR family, contains REC and winged-helix (WHTH) domain n=1 Tax=Pontibacter ummariensis TaxID=1610492 RepID=A0A239JTE6_9BACT|nr:response regulator transcription factor [Pontibacter ummariensis]PRY07408.1 DNA-binding response OmpR family regulator [Pontibacter ummariensis]SNT08728.1 DNA-binding response regulator, OmpR family, contains REC and winged-helix (wHTH) domain [Pontibacter ummariensis]
MKILLVEDEPKVASFIKKGLEEQAYEVDQAYDGLFGVKMALQHEYDLVILDIILPNMNGLDVCREIRKHNTTVSILMLTALGTTDDKITGLDAGADDYLTKPFEFKELLARIRALSRRGAESSAGEKLCIADLEMDLLKKTVTRGGKPVNLTAREFALLHYLLRNQGRVVSRVDITEQVWETSFDTGSNVIDVYINFLRKKIDKNHEPKLIHTLVGMGYVLKEQGNL